MADENKPTDKPVDEAPQGKPSETPVGSEKPVVSPEEQARRDQQSQRDKEASQGKDDTLDRLDFLESREMERARDSYISDFLGKNASKYPHVKAEDLKYATSKDEIEELATHLENRYKDMEQSALQNVQFESDSKPLTDEEIAKRETELEETQKKTGKSQFGNFIDTISRRKR